MESPLLPFKVIERIIDHSGNKPKTLYNFSLTCRDLRPRALCLLVDDVCLTTRTKIFDFCDFLKTKPHLNSFVRSIALDPTDFAPFPLLDLLPNLSHLTFADFKNSWPRISPPSSRIHIRHLRPLPVTVLNRTSLTCCKHLGTHIQALHLTRLYFSTFIEFARILLSFKNVSHLVCSEIIIKAEGNRAHLDMIKRRMREQLHLLTIDIDFCAGNSLDPSLESQPSPPGALLLDSGSVQSTVETLILELTGWCRLSHTVDYSRLRILVLRLKDSLEYIAGAITLLNIFHRQASLEHVMVKIERQDVHSIAETLLGGGDGGLEQTLLRFRQPRVECLINHLREGSRLFWVQELEKRFPVLFQRGAFIVTSLTVIPGSGHDGAVQDIAVSPDGKWVATASLDSTVILWHSADGAISRQWVAHSYFPVNSLVFSPDGRHLVSGGGDKLVKVWDLAEEGSREVTTLEGHTNHVTRCAWSPHGDTIASASYDRTIRLWDVRTSHQLHVLKHAGGFTVGIQFITFSPDGRWLVSGCSNSLDCDVWKVDSGTLHKSFRIQNDDNDIFAHIIAAFDPTSISSTGTRLAVVSELQVVTIFDVETGAELAVLRTVDENYDPLSFVSFSPDGTLVAASIADVVKIWDTHTGAELFSLENETWVYQACFSPCGKYIVSSSDVGVVRLWRTRDGSSAATLSEHKGSPMRFFTFTADGETLWSADVHGRVMMRRMRDIIPADELD